MYLWILFGVLVVIGIVAIIVAIIIDKKFEYSFIVWPTVVATLTLFIAFFIGLGCIFCTIDTPRELNQFKAQKQYIETHVAKDSIENAALTAGKIEQNEWLYDAQYGVENWHGWNFYPDNVKDLKPIQ